MSQKKTEFTGFAAFASHSSTAAAAIQLSQQKQTSKPSKATTSTTAAAVLKPSPVYTGTDSNLIQIFKRIGQKKDAITKSRALLELSSHVYPCTTTNADNNNGTSSNSSDATQNKIAQTSNLKKSDQITALSHFFFLFANKLIHENQMTVQRDSMKVLGNAIVHVPKAFRTLLLHKAAAEEEEVGVGSVGNVIGWVYTFQFSQISEVAKTAKLVWKQIYTLLQDTSQQQEELVKLIQSYVVSHVESILKSSARAQNLANALSVIGNNNNNNNSSNNGSSGKTSTKQKKGNKQSKQQNQSSQDTKTLSEMEKEEIEERYERVVLLTLRGMGHFVRDFPESKNGTESYHTLFGNDAVLWKHLSNTRGSFRRVTYSLLASLSQHAISVIHPTSIGPSTSTTTTSEKKKSSQNLSTLILNILSSEKDPANFPSLFEMILLYIASFRKLGDNDDGPERAWNLNVTKDNKDDDAFDLNGFVKAMAKTLRRACYGSPADQWCPTLLPLLASFPRGDGQIQFQVLSNLWSGRTAAVSAADTASIVVAVAECAAFLLLRKPINDEEISLLDDEVASDLGQLFLDAFSFYLTMPSGTSSSRKATNELVKVLIKNLYQLDRAYGRKEGNAYSKIEGWFWNEGMVNTLISEEEEVNELMYARLHTVLNGISKLWNEISNPDKTTAESNFRPIMQQFFHDVMVKNRVEVPRENEASLIHAIFDYCGVENIFIVRNDDFALIEKFCLKSLFPWLVIITSNHTTSTKIIQVCFRILLMILKSITVEEKRESLWKTVLQLLIKDPYDLGQLAMGLFELGVNNPDFITCTELDAFVDQVGTFALDTFLNHLSSISHDQLGEVDDGVSLFLKTCTGLVPNMSSMLVSQDVIKKLSEKASSPDTRHLVIHSTNNILLEVLISLSLHSEVDTEKSDILQLILTAWRQGGPTWYNEEVQMILRKDPSFVTPLIEAASLEIKEDLERAVNGAEEDIDLNAFLWSQRAWRLVSIPGFSENATSSSSVSFLGFDEIFLKSASCTENKSIRSGIYLCLMYFVQNQESISERKRIIGLGELSTKNNIFIFLSMALAKGTSPIHLWNKDETFQCQALFKYLGGVTEIGIATVEGYVFEVIELLAEFMKDFSPMNLSLVERGVIVLDWLLSLWQDQENPNNPTFSTNAIDNVDPAKLNTGDTVWYVTDGQDKHSKRIKVSILKVHTDDYPNLYFSIQLDDGQGGQNVRQTVSERLKTQENLVTKQISEDSKKFLHRLEEAMVYRLIKPNFSGDNLLSDTLAEVLNIVISRCGLLGKSGLGTVRYDVFQTISSLENTICQQSKDTSMTSQTCSLLKRLSFALGYGRLTEKSEHSCTIMRFDCKNVMESILQCFEDGQLNVEEMNDALLMWFTVSLDSAMTTENASQIWTMMDLITTSVKDDNSNGQDMKWAQLSLEAIDTMQRKAESLDIDKASCIASEQNVFSNILEMFVKYTTGLDGVADIGEYFEEGKEAFIRNKATSPFKSFIVQCIKAKDAAFLHGAKMHLEDLCTTLVSPKKQWCVFQTLSFLAQSKQELYSDDVVEIPPSTKVEFQTWKHGLEGEELEELEEDILATAKWLPHNLMTDIESWKANAISGTSQEEKHEEEEENDDGTTTLHFLKWLLCLEFLDAAATCDMRNRTHITTYIDKTGAVKEILETALNYTTLNKNNQNPTNNIWSSCTSIQTSEEADTTNDHHDDDNEENNYSLWSLSNLATLVIFRTVESMPTLCKKWWSDYCPRAQQPVVNKFVENTVAPETLRRDLSRIEKATNLGDLVVNGSCVSREVTATYIQDESKLSVIIRVPPSFPLRNVEVDCQKTLGISEKRWKYWSLQIMRMLNSQDGSILDALLLWKQNVDKEFEGVEPCPVCYSVLCVKTHAMPNLECKTCKNRFHSSCLYKWFNSSGKNQCVICQQPWQGTKIG